MPEEIITKDDVGTLELEQPEVVVTNAEVTRYKQGLGGRVFYAGDGTEADPPSYGTLVASEERRNIKKCRYDVALDDGRLVRELDPGTLVAGGRWSIAEEG